MASTGRELLEAEVRRLCAEGNTPGAAAAAVRGYGPEILGFLAALHRSREDAHEVFALWSERIFLGLPGFGWACSLRTWAYTLARNASKNYVRGQKNRRRHELPAESAELLAAEQKVRTETRPYLRTTAKDKLAALREALPPDDRTLLVLRVDKGLEWRDLARVMSDDTLMTDADLTRESQRLRKRFQLLKEKLVEAGKRQGIFDEG